MWPVLAWLKAILIWGSVRWGRDGPCHVPSSGDFSIKSVPYQNLSRGFCGHLINIDKTGGCSLLFQLLYHHNMPFCGCARARCVYKLWDDAQLEWFAVKCSNSINYIHTKNSWRKRRKKQTWDEEWYGVVVDCGYQLTVTYIFNIIIWMQTRSARLLCYPDKR